MLDISQLKKGEIFYFVHKYCWFYKLQVIQQEANGYVICRNITDGIPCEGRIEVLETQSKEYFKEFNEAENYYKKNKEERLRELSDEKTLLTELYTFAKEVFPDFEAEFYQEAIQHVLDSKEK